MCVSLQKKNHVIFSICKNSLFGTCETGGEVGQLWFQPACAFWAACEVVPGKQVHKPQGRSLSEGSINLNHNQDTSIAPVEALKSLQTHPQTPQIPIDIQVRITSKLK